MTRCTKYVSLLLASSMLLPAIPEFASAVNLPHEMVAPHAPPPAHFAAPTINKRGSARTTQEVDPITGKPMYITHYEQVTTIPRSRQPQIHPLGGPSSPSPVDMAQGTSSMSTGKKIAIGAGIGGVGAVLGAAMATGVNDYKQNENAKECANGTGGTNCPTTTPVTGTIGSAASSTSGSAATADPSAAAAAAAAQNSYGSSGYPSTAASSNSSGVDPNTLAALEASLYSAPSTGAASGVTSGATPSASSNYVLAPSASSSATAAPTSVTSAAPAAVGTLANPYSATTTASGIPPTGN